MQIRYRLMHGTRELPDVILRRRGHPLQIGDGILGSELIDRLEAALVPDFLEPADCDGAVSFLPATHGLLLDAQRSSDLETRP
jgi:hypothetical protein